MQAGRVEDLREVGDFITYDIGPDSVIIVKSAEDELSAYHNVCPHRGRRLVDTPDGQRNARGTRKNFICGYHGWTFGLDGENTYIAHEDDWQGSSVRGRADLGKVNVDTWGGWIWINLDPECEPLAEYLGVVPEMLDPYQLQNMRAALAQVDRLRLQLEGGDGGVLRDLSRRHHPSRIQRLRPVSWLGAQSRPAHQHRLRSAQGNGRGFGQDARGHG